MSTSTIAEFESSLQANDFQGLEEAWTTILSERPKDQSLHLRLAAKLADKNERKRAAQFLVAAAEGLEEAGEYEQAFDEYVKASDYFPNLRSKDEQKRHILWEGVLRLAPLAFHDVPEIDRIVQEGAEAHEGKTNQFLEYLTTYTTFRPGDWVKHEKGWGIGKVTGVEPDNGKLIVDFESKQGHKFNLEAAGRMLIRLDKESLDVWKSDRLAELQALCKDKPVEVMKIALRSERQRQLTQRELKTRLVPDVMDQKTWSKFLTTVKKAAQKDDFIKVGTGQNPTLTLLEEALTFEDAAVEKFAMPGTWEEKLERARDILAHVNEHSHDPSEVLPPIVHYFNGVLSEDPERAKVSGLAAIFVLRELGAAVDGSDATIEELPTQLPTPSQYFHPNDPGAYLDMLCKIPVPRYHREGLQVISREAPQAWVETLKQAFLMPSTALWEEALAQCEKTGHMELFIETREELFRDPMTHPDGFLWCVRQTFNKSEENGTSTDDLYHLLDKTLTLASRLTHAHGRGDKTAKPSLLKLKTALSEDQNGMLRKILKVITPDQASHLYKHIDSCTALGNNLPPKLRRLIRKEHPGVEQPVQEVGFRIDPSVTITTIEGLKKQQTLANQLREDIDENAKAIGAALEMGDISENAELDAARERESRLKSRLSEVQKQLNNVDVLTEDNIDTDRIVPGTRVTIRDEDSDRVETLTILGPWDTDTEGVISYRTEMASALLGSSVGDVVVFAGQNDRRARIESIENALTAAAGSPKSKKKAKAKG